MQNRIHCSEKTAQLLVDSGKEHWVKQRDEMVTLKGKGNVSTYWVMPRTPSTSNGNKKVGINFVDECSDVESDTMMLNSDSVCGSVTGYSDMSSVGSNNQIVNSSYWSDMKLVQELAIESSRQQRLVEWNVVLLSGYLKQIQAQRLDILKQKNAGSESKSTAWKIRPDATENSNRHGTVGLRLQDGSTALDEVTESIQLPQFDAKIHSMAKKTRPESIQLDELVELELKDYVTTIASMYRSNR